MTQTPMTPNYQTPPGGDRSNALPIISMILGIVSIFPLCCIVGRPYIEVVVGIGAIALAVVARGKIARGEARGSGMATTGMVTGVIGTLLGLLILIVGLTAPSYLNKWGQQFGQQIQQKVKEQEEKQRQQQQQHGGDSTSQPTTDSQ